MSISPRKAMTAKKVTIRPQPSGQLLLSTRTRKNAGAVNSATTVAARLSLFHSRARAACSGRIPRVVVVGSSTSGSAYCGHRRVSTDQRSNICRVNRRRDLSAPCRVAPMPASPVQYLGRRLGAALLAAAAAAAFLPGMASAQLRWRTCSDVDGFQCAILRVPLDRTGAVKGTILLQLAREGRTVKGGRIFISYRVRSRQRAGDGRPVFRVVLG